MQGTERFVEVVARDKEMGWQLNGSGFSGMALVIACRIHQEAYVEKRLPVLWSKRKTARINPMHPSWVRSARLKPLSV